MSVNTFRSTLSVIRLVCISQSARKPQSRELSHSAMKGKAVMMPLESIEN